MTVMPKFLMQLLGKSSADTAEQPEFWACTRETVGQTMEHAQALAELLRAELGEYVERQRRRTICMVLAAVLLLGAYATGCALLAVVLAPLTGLPMALAIVLLLNVAVALLLLIWAAAQGKEPLAPATRTELENDWQCLKLLIKGNAKS